MNNLSRLVELRDKAQARAETLQAQIDKKCLQAVENHGLTCEAMGCVCLCSHQQASKIKRGMFHVPRLLIEWCKQKGL